MKNCGHYIKQCVPDCDECVIDALINRVTDRARREWLTQIHEQDQSRYARIVAALRRSQKNGQM